MVGKELGKFKLEHVFKEIIFLCPKVYAGITDSGEYICKIKGFKYKPNFGIFKELLYKNSIVKLNHDKNIKQNNSIKIKKELYELQITEHKRNIIYKNNIAVDTSPFKVKDNNKIK